MARVPQATRVPHRHLPSDLLALARAHRARQQTLARAARDRLRRLWRFVSAANAQGSWLRVAPRALIVVRAALVEAARGVDEYVAAALRFQGGTPAPAGVVMAEAFARAAADGRPLDTLLGYPAFEVTAFVAGGMDHAQALAAGERHLDRIVATEITDAARTATGVAIVNDRTTYGWIRMLTPPSCNRCILLAGQWYEYNQGFERHPQCDCVHIPAAEVIEPESPKAVFDAMSDEERRRAGWSRADIAAVVGHDADLYQVTNAHMERYGVTLAGQQLRATTVGATRRGLAGQRLGARKGKPVVRLTTDSLYAEARRLGWSRDELLRQLKRFGYIL